MSVAAAQPLGIRGGDRAFVKSRYFAETGYTPHASQHVIHYDPHRFRVLACGRRWGKTLLGAKDAEACAFAQNLFGQAQRGWIVGPQYDDCEKEFRVMYDTLRALDVHLVSQKFLNNPDSGNMHIKTNWGFDVECRSAAYPETLTGEGLDFVLMVEAGRHKRRTWGDFIRPTLSDRRGWGLFSGVPEGSTLTSLLFALWQRGQRQKGQWRSWRMPSWTNTITFPGGRHDPEILDAEDDLTEDEFLRQYGAEFVERAGRVMKEWDDDVHLADLAYNPEWPLYAAVDYGYRNPFVWLWIQVDRFDNVYVIGEERTTQKDAEEVVKEILAPHPWTKKCVAFYPDPSRPDETSILERHLGVAPRTNTGGEIGTRLALIRRKLKTYPAHIPLEDQRPGLYVDRSCTALAWEMREGYRWPEHKSEVRSDSENPLDRDNHGPEALGRFMKGYFEVVSDEPSESRIMRARMRR
jgi:hypothetical protein